LTSYYHAFQGTDVGESVEGAVPLPLRAPCGLRGITPLLSGVQWWMKKEDASGYFSSML